MDLREQQRNIGWARKAGKGAGAVGSVLRAWIADDGASMSASVAFFAAFSLAPMLVIAIAVGSLFFGIDAVQGRLQSGVEAVVGAEGAAVVQAMLASAWKTGGGGWTGWLSVLMMAVGASATFAELNHALNLIWRVHGPDRPVSSMLRVRLISFGLVVGIGFLIVILLIADALIIYGAERLLSEAGVASLLNFIQLSISFCFLWFAFATLLKVLPDAPVRWRHAAIGGLVAALLFAIGKQLFARYLVYAGTASAFGAAGSLAVLMMWLFFSAAVFLVGAQVAAHSSRTGRTPGQTASGVRVAETMDTERGRGGEHGHTDLDRG